jgi:predicted molibdopterin-dependent oxidoreductase YjgC
MRRETHGQFRRIAAGMRRPIAIEIDGERANALEGDSLLTALLVNRRALGKFEFTDERRGGFCLIGSCQDCWITLGDGNRARACTTLAEDGMRVSLSRVS